MTHLCWSAIGFFSQVPGGNFLRVGTIFLTRQKSNYLLIKINKTKYEDVCPSPWTDPDSRTNNDVSYRKCVLIVINVCGDTTPFRVPIGLCQRCIVHSPVADVLYVAGVKDRTDPRR